MTRLRCASCGNLVWFDLHLDGAVIGVRIGVGGRVHPMETVASGVGRTAHIRLEEADGYVCRRCGERTAVHLL